MQKFSETITYKKSNGSIAVMSGFTATIYNAGTLVLATLYEDDEVATLTNPLVSDTNGLVQCKLANGAYDIVFSNGTASQTIEGYVAFDPAEPTSLTITGGTIDNTVIGGTTPANATVNDLTVEGDFHN